MTKESAPTFTKLRTLRAAKPARIERMRSFDLRQSEQQAASSSPKSAVTMLARSNEECGNDDVAVRTVDFAGGLGLRPIGGFCAAGASSWRRTRQGIGARACACFADYPDPAPNGMPVDLPNVKTLSAFHPTRADPLELRIETILSIVGGPEAETFRAPLLLGHSQAPSVASA